MHCNQTLKYGQYFTVIWTVTYVIQYITVKCKGFWETKLPLLYSAREKIKNLLFVDWTKKHVRLLVNICMSEDESNEVHYIAKYRPQVSLFISSINVSLHVLSTVGQTPP